MTKGLTSDTIGCILLRALKKWKGKFIGVVGRDGLPELEESKVCAVVNTDLTRGPGIHWVCFFKENNKVEFFDSGGRPASFYQIPHSHDWHNTIPLQDPSSVVCGHYCIMFLVMRSEGYSANDIISSLSSFGMHPDKLVEIILDRLIETLPSCHNSYKTCCNHGLPQCCRPLCESQSSPQPPIPPRSFDIQAFTPTDTHPFLSNPFRNDSTIQDPDDFVLPQ